METHRFNLVIPVELWKRLKARAKENRRSVTQEILEAIEDHLERTWRIAPEDDELAGLIQDWTKMVLKWKKVIVYEPTTKRQLRSLREMIDQEIEEE